MHGASQETFALLPGSLGEPRPPCRRSGIGNEVGKTIEGTGGV